LRGERRGADGTVADCDGELPAKESRHQRRLHDQRAQRGGCVHRVEERGQVRRRRDRRLRRRRVSGRSQRAGRNHRRDVAAVSAPDGVEGRLRGRDVREDGEEGRRLHRHGRQPDHGEADVGRPLEGRCLRPRELLGLEPVLPRRRPARNAPAAVSETMNATSDTTAPELVPRRAGAVAVARRILGVQAVAPLIALVLTSAFFSLKSDAFLHAQNFSLILQQVMVVGVLAVGQTLVILTAGIDLSVGTVMAFGQIVMTKLAVANGVEPLLAIALGILACVAFGLLNGTLVAGIRLPPFIVTLGTFNIALALTHAYSNDLTYTSLPREL